MLGETVLRGLVPVASSSWAWLGWWGPRGEAGGVLPCLVCAGVFDGVKLPWPLRCPQGASLRLSLPV